MVATRRLRQVGNLAPLGKLGPIQPGGRCSGYSDAGGLCPTALMVRWKHQGRDCGQASAWGVCVGMYVGVALLRTLLRRVDVDGCAGGTGYGNGDVGVDGLMLQVAVVGVDWNCN